MKDSYLILKNYRNFYNWIVIIRLFRNSTKHELSKIVFYGEIQVNEMAKITNLDNCHVDLVTRLTSHDSKGVKIIGYLTGEKIFRDASTADRYRKFNIN